MSGSYQRGVLATAQQGIAPLEVMGTLPLEVAGGAGLTAYVGLLNPLVGGVPRVLVRGLLIDSGTTATTATVWIARGVTGHTIVAQTLHPINAASGTPATQCLAAGTIIGVSPLAQLFQTPAPLGVGGTNIPWNNASGFPVFLFPGDAIIIGGTSAASAQIGLVQVNCAEFAS